MKRNVVLDLDDCLANFRDPMCSLLNEKTLNTLHWNAWHSYNVGETFYGITEKQFCDYIIEHNILENIKPHDESKSLLSELNNRNYNIIIISSRGFHPNAEEVTKKWFIEHDIPFDEIYITKHGMKKADLVKDRKLTFAVDDNIDNCETFVEAGNCDHVLLYDMPWNQNCDLSRIKTLNDIYCYI